MLGNSDSYPLSRHGRAPYPVMAGLDPAIRRGTSLRQMTDWVAGCDEWGFAVRAQWAGPTQIAHDAIPTKAAAQRCLNRIVRKISLDARSEFR
jgi:hypothetical protein